MRPHKISLQLRGLRRFDSDIGEVAKSGRHAVDRPALSQHPFDDRAGRLHALPRLGGERDLQAIASYGSDLRDRQVTPRQLESLELGEIGRRHGRTYTTQ